MTTHIHYTEFSPSLTPEDSNFLAPEPINSNHETCSTRNDGYFCTRPRGHSGAHAAHGSDTVMFARWEQK